MPTVYSPPVSTYVALATTTLGASASTVTFSSIPASYRDLILIGAGTTGASSLFYLRFNGDTGSNYSRIRALGYSGGPYSDATTATSISDIAQFDTNQGNFIAHIMDYSATDKHTAVLMRASNKGAGETVMGAGRWANTAAITSVTCTLNTSSFAIGSTFSLYGIEA
jgi:hypothetical protein